MHLQTESFSLTATARVFLWVGLFSLLAACDGEQPALPPLAGNALILAFGDSLTFGTGAPPEQSYPARLAALSGRQVINAGRPGETSAQGLKRLPDILDKHQPQLLILCHGGNDLLRKRKRAKTEANLREMVLLARARSVPVVLIGVPRPGLFLNAADLYAKLATELNIPMEAESLPELLGDNRYKSDLIHPNAAGYQRFAEAIHGLLRATGALP